MSGACPSLGIILSIEWPPGTPDASRQQFEVALWRFSGESGLVCSGGGDIPRYVLMSESAQLTDQDRDTIASWARAQLAERTWRVSAVADLDELR